MTRQQAHELLDMARHGIPVTTERITSALRVTGDLPRGGVFIEAMTEQRRRPVGSWEGTPVPFAPISVFHQVPA